VNTKLFPLEHSEDFACMQPTGLNETIPKIQSFQLAVANLWGSVNANVFCGSKVEFEIENTEYLNSKTVLRIYYLLDTVNSPGTSRGK